ncbi:hypothetical protein [uncultured Arcobacter sp.]|uniref:hypothetical protein n=1 Tax=uncultured Arcobacter sp. TaxID=165434 RepID=UPI0026126161|nr:hypothetical protein [uncultured Arcobacter sp.]
MNKFLSIILFTFLLFLSGCSSYSITKYFDKDDFYLNSLQYTKKTDIIKDEEVVALFTATYLNKVEEKYDDNYENFIVSVYVANNKKSETPNITIDKQSYTQEELEDEKNYEKNYVEIKEIEKESKLIESIPLKNPWAKYYLIKFDKNNDLENFLLRYRLNQTLKAEISF